MREFDGEINDGSIRIWGFRALDMLRLNRFWNLVFLVC